MSSPRCLLFMNQILIVAVVTSAASCIILAYAFVPDFSTFNSPHISHTQFDGTINLEHTSAIVRGGEAKFYARLKIDKDFMDVSKSCDHCNKVEYTPSGDNKAGIAYSYDKLDLKGYQRIVFFAKGQQGGEVVSFIAIGRTTSDTTPSYGDTFPNQQFTIVTKNVTLDKTWKRYEISVNKTNLEDVTHPFGFVIYGHMAGAEEVLYLKGVTFDRKPAQHPLLTLNTTV